MLSFLLLTLIVAILAGARATGPGWAARLGRALRWGGMVGLVGFLGGFFGPMLFAPSANQGPMVGIFLTGPLGFVLGFIIGAVREIRDSRKPHDPLAL